MSKNFNDFIDSINSDEINDIIGTSKLINFNLTNESLQEYTDTILTKSFDMSVNLLQKYHDWLNSQE